MLSVELYGVDAIPETERTGRPLDIVSMLIGSNLCLGVIVFGWLPISFGLSFWSAVTSLTKCYLYGCLYIPGIIYCYWCYLWLSRIAWCK